MGESFYGDELYGAGNYSQSPYVHYTVTMPITFGASARIAAAKSFAAVAAIIIASVPHLIRTRTFAASMPIRIASFISLGRARTFAASMPIRINASASLALTAVFAATGAAVFASTAALQVVRAVLLSATMPISVDGYTGAVYFGPLWIDGDPEPNPWSDTTSEEIWQDTTPAPNPWGN